MVKGITLVNQLRAYLANFTPDETAVTFISLGIIYTKNLPDDDWHLD